MVGAGSANGQEPLVIHHQDPLQVFQNHRAYVDATLQNAVNSVGRDVMVADGVILWGGKRTDCVGIRLGNGVRLYETCRLSVDRASENSGIVLGDGVQVNPNVFIDGSGGVEIGANTLIATNVVILSSSHNIDASAPVSRSGKKFKPVRIGKDVWIGANAVILFGKSIGDGAVIGAGAVVTKDVPPRKVVVGNPARVLRSV